MLTYSKRVGKDEFGNTMAYMYIIVQPNREEQHCLFVRNALLKDTAENKEEYARLRWNPIDRIAFKTFDDFMFDVLHSYDEGFSIDRNDSHHLVFSVLQWHQDHYT